MRGATTIQERLWELRKDKGLNLEELSKLTGISKSALASYESNDYKDINHGNLITLADFYGVTLDYLFCRTENREQINTPLTELHLDDEMVELLKSGRINNRLLCELTTHKDFIKFLADIEIYVDGIANMQIQNLNALVDTVRHEIIERYRPGEDDPYLKVLQAAHVDDDEYFSRMVLDDINLIIRDVRALHKKDSESAPQTSVADELKENLDAVEKFKGSHQEKQAILYCKQLGINYKNLSEEEFRWLIRILQKSKKMGSPISQRKKRK
ncbi:helix-turn-helix domain-containing protein [Blautia sp.]|uniref:helix-turn-helix domain-containing protein n=1 Tax=Blautia sp. TaxID=1955243 RepID=UPI002582A2FA|nr:helix-turn-helix domain-containing protein [Blautia sp.]